MKAIEYLILTVILACALYTAATMGYTRGYDANIEPVSEFVEFSDYKSSYKLHKDSSYRTERIEDNFEVSYYIYIWHEDNFTVIEYQDTLIDGEFTFAKHWMQSFIANFGGLK